MTVEQIVFETQRLRLSKVRGCDADFILKLLNDEGFIRNIRDEGIRTVEQVREHIALKYTASYQNNGFGMYKTSLKSTGVAIGVCGFVKRDILDCPDIGYAFLAEYGGLGYASESAIGIMDYGLNQLGMKRIVGITSVDNKPSIKILEKVGLIFDKMIVSGDGDTMLFVPNDK